MFQEQALELEGRAQSLCIIVIVNRLTLESESVHHDDECYCLSLRAGDADGKKKKNKFEKHPELLLIRLTLRFNSHKKDKYMGVFRIFAVLLQHVLCHRFLRGKAASINTVERLP